MSRGYQIFPRSNDFRDHWNETFGHSKSENARHTVQKNSPVDEDQAEPIKVEMFVPQWAGCLSESDLGSDPPDDSPDKG